MDVEASIIKGLLLTRFGAIIVFKEVNLPFKVMVCAVKPILPV